MAKANINNYLESQLKNFESMEREAYEHNFKKGDIFEYQNERYEITEIQDTVSFLDEGKTIILEIEPETNFNLDCYKIEIINDVITRATVI